MHHPVPAGFLLTTRIGWAREVNCTLVLLRVPRRLGREICTEPCRCELVSTVSTFASIARVDCIIEARAQARLQAYAAALSFDPTSHTVARSQCCNSYATQRRVVAPRLCKFSIGVDPALLSASPKRQQTPVPCGAVHRQSCPNQSRAALASSIHCTQSHQRPRSSTRDAVTG